MVSDIYRYEIVKQGFLKFSTSGLMYGMFGEYRN